MEAIRETDRVRTVHNFRVADYHTYFVGGKEWGFSVWVHNARYTPSTDLVDAYALQRRSGNVDWDTIDPNLTTRQQSAIRRAAREQGIAIPTPNSFGSPGNLSHQQAVGLLKEMAESEFPGQIIHMGTSIRGRTGLARNPDVWVQDVVTKKVLKVYEAARKQNPEQWMPREQLKMIDYNNAGLPHQFEEVF